MFTIIYFAFFHCETFNSDPGVAEVLFDPNGDGILDSYDSMNSWITPDLPSLEKWLASKTKSGMRFVNDSSGVYPRGSFVCIWHSTDLSKTLPTHAFAKRVSYTDSLKHWIDIQKVVQVNDFLYVCL